MIDLFCTLCAKPLSIVEIQNGEGAKLGCENGHHFWYSPAHLEKGDILVIGDLSFQCADEAPYEELIGENE
jgi:hypothetical protein